jgi:hypothetical protein
MAGWYHSIKLPTLALVAGLSSDSTLESAYAHGSAKSGDSSKDLAKFYFLRYPPGGIIVVVRSLTVGYFAIAAQG